MIRGLHRQARLSPAAGRGRWNRRRADVPAARGPRQHRSRRRPLPAGDRGTGAPCWGQGATHGAGRQRFLHPRVNPQSGVLRCCSTLGAVLPAPDGVPASPSNNFEEVPMSIKERFTQLQPVAVKAAGFVKRRQRAGARCPAGSAVHAWPPGREVPSPLTSGPPGLPTPSKPEGPSHFRGGPSLLPQAGAGGPGRPDDPKYTHGIERGRPSGGPAFRFSEEAT